MMGRPGRPGGRAVGVISLGCPKNLVDTEVMLGLLAEAGFRTVSDPDRADVLLVNTCCFIEAARQEATDALAEAAQWRRKGEGRALICAGCWPEMDAAALRERFPEIDAFMGPGDVADVVSVVEGALTGKGTQEPQSPPSAYLFEEDAPRLQATPPWTAYLKIADGCSHRCRFCTIPQARGRYRSRTREAIVREARDMSQRGVREINLVAQDTTAYGTDTGECDLGDLLSALARVERIRWLRLLYGHPSGITEKLIEAMAAHTSVCDYLDVPFQHADRDVLHKMGRPGDADTYLKLIEHLRAAMPDIAIRSTFLVGFPGEGEDEFRRLLDFVEAAQLDRTGAFCYSPEQGTAAAEMDDQVPSGIAQERYHELMTLQQRVSLSRNERWVGRELDVLMESPGEGDGEWIGRSFRDAPEIDGTVKLRRRRAPRLGEFVRARVVAAEPYDLVAETAGRASRPAPGSRGRGRRR
jgi:ribosomal protein S12 methylthiotransferase